MMLYCPKSLFYIRFPVFCPANAIRQLLPEFPQVAAHRDIFPLLTPSEYEIDVCMPALLEDAAETGRAFFGSKTEKGELTDESGGV
jgi:hypothetical protein